MDAFFLGTKKHLANLWTLTENHIKTYDSNHDKVIQLWAQPEISGEGKPFVELSCALAKDPDNKTIEINIMCSNRLIFLLLT